MSEVLSSIFGEYTPTLFYDGAGNVVGAHADWQWILGVCLFGVVLYSFFRLVGLLFQR